MKSPLLRKQGLDALLEALNDPEVAINDPRADKQFEHPYGSKGTEPETVKQGHKEAAALLRSAAGSKIEECAARAVAILGKNNIPSLIVGGYAVQELGYPRQTIDVDIVVPSPSAAEALLARYGFSKTKYPSTVVEKMTGVEVDLMQAGASLSGSKVPLPQVVEVVTVPKFIDLLTLIDVKLGSYASLPINRSRDLGDVVELIKRNRLDQDVLQGRKMEDLYRKVWVQLHEEQRTKQGRWGIVEDLIGRPHPPEELPKKQPSDDNLCPVCGGGLTRAYTEGGKSTEMICTRCKFLPGKRGGAKPKCPHCGSSDYNLMPTDFETAKCNSCGKNWDHGIIEGINDPKTAAGWKSVLPIALSLGLGAPTATPSLIPTRPPAVQEQKESPKPKIHHDHHMDQLIKAISRAEGAKPERNNPGNIADFQTGKIKTFKTYEEGVAALKKQLDRIAEGKHPKIRPEMPLRDAGLIYSNGDPNWSRNISQILHVPETTPIVHLIKGTKRSSVCKEAAANNLAGWWYNKASKSLVDVRGDMGGGTNDHVGFLWASNGRNAARIGVSKEDAHALYMAYGYDEQGNDLPDATGWGEEAFAAVARILEKNVRVLLYGSKEDVKELDVLVGSPSDVSYLNTQIVPRIKVQGYQIQPGTNVTAEYEQNYARAPYKDAQFARSWGELQRMKVASRGINVATILNGKKFAAKNEPDPGQYDFKHEDHVREEAKQWAQYAEASDNTPDIKPYDPEGNYLCGDCDMRQGENECMRVQGPINFTKGSCRLFHEGAPENKLPMTKKFTQAEAKYGESNQGGFGCHRCEYGGKAKESDTEGRPSWCSFWGMHIDPMSCCAEQELVKIQSKSARQLLHDDSGATTGLRNRPDYGESDSYTSKANEANKTGMKHPLLQKKKADVEMHETPQHLPPRDDMRRHLDVGVQKEIDDGVDAPVQEGVKLGDSASHPAYDADQELRTELWLDDVADARSEARNSFMEDPFMQQEVKESGLSMEQLWEQYGTDYANEYWANRQGSKKAMKAEDGVSVCPKCNSSLVEEVTDNEGSDFRLLECKDCAHLFSL